MSATKRVARSLHDSLREVLTLNALPGETAGFSADDHDEAASFLLDVAARRERGRALIRLESRGGAEAGNRRMRLGIANDDMPFLVDSVSMEIARQGLTLHLIVHPVFSVQRDAKGVLQSLAPRQAAPDQPGRRPRDLDGDVCSHPPGPDRPL